MTVHLTNEWLWWSLFALYVTGVLVGMFMTIIMDDPPRWWLRPVILVWPAYLAGLTLYHAGRFMIGRD